MDAVDRKCPNEFNTSFNIDIDGTSSLPCVFEGKEWTSSEKMVCCCIPQIGDILRFGSNCNLYSLVLDKKHFVSWLTFFVFCFQFCKELNNLLFYIL